MLTNVASGFEKLGQYIATGYQDLSPGKRALSIAWLGASAVALVGSSYYLYNNSQQVLGEKNFILFNLPIISLGAIKSTAIAAVGVFASAAAFGGELIGLAMHGKEVDDSLGGGIALGLGSPKTGASYEENEKFLNSLPGVKLFESSKR